MIKRLFLLLIFLIIRCVLGWSSTLLYAVDREVVVTGDVVNIYYKDKNCIMVVGNFLIGAENICAGEKGSRVKVIGRLERRVIDGFSGRLWLVSKQIERLEKTKELKESRSQGSEWLNNFRESLVLVYKKYVPEPEAGLISGIVLGYKNDIGQDFYNRMVKSGSVHIAVASGYNILLVGGVVLSIGFWFLRRSKAIWVAISAMIFYAVLAGGDPPVVRAVWMAGLMYLGQVLGRGSITAWILLLTAWVMLMIEPSLVASASFQLSVAASFGLMVVEPWLSAKSARLIGGEPMELLGKIGLSTTVATMFMTLPIIWWHFGRMSLIGIVSNILILPLVPPLMMFGVGMLVIPGILAVPTYVLAHWIVLMINFFGT